MLNLSITYNILAVPRWIISSLRLFATKNSIVLNLIIFSSYKVNYCLNTYWGEIFRSFLYNLSQAHRNNILFFVLSHLNRAVDLVLAPPPASLSLLQSSSTSVTRHRRLTCRSRSRSRRSLRRWAKNLTMNAGWLTVQQRDLDAYTCWRSPRAGVPQTGASTDGTEADTDSLTDTQHH